MNLTLLLPLGVALAAAASAGAMQRRLRPAVATWALTAVAVVTAGAVVAGMVAIVFGVAAEVPWLAARVGWCHHFHQRSLAVPVVLGPPAAVWLPVVGVRAIRCRRRYTRLSRDSSESTDAGVIQTDVPTAYAVSGRPGRLVISTGLLDRLRPDECAVVFAHERSHLAHQHGRFIHATQLAALTFPPLRLLVAQVRFATERWADEDAAEVVGDRRLVARAIARAALVQSGAPSADALALSGLGVPARVEAMLDEPDNTRLAVTAVGLLGSSAMLALMSSGVQVHHLVELADHICRF